MEMYYPFFLLLQLISLTVSNLEETVPYDGSFNYILSCGDVTTSFNSKPPRVEWYIQTEKPGSHSLITLNDTNYWWRKYQNDVCAYGSGSFPKFVGPSNYNCTKHSTMNSTVQYACNYSNVDLQPGKYVCKIFTHQVFDQYKLHVEKSISVEWDQDFIIEPRTRACFMPTASNLSADFLSNHLGYQINATWNSSKKPSFFGCVRPFCIRSRRFKVKLLIFNSPPRGVAPTPNDQTTWLQTMKRRQTFYLFEGLQISPVKYYTFQVKNSRSWSTYAPNKDYTQTESSDVCHFGQQEAAYIESSTNFFHASYGESITLRCRGGGLPAPTMSLLYVRDGNYITLREGTSMIEYTIYIFKSEELLCRASNTIIQPLPCGQVKDFQEIANITIDI